MSAYLEFQCIGNGCRAYRLTGWRGVKDCLDLPENYFGDISKPCFYQKSNVDPPVLYLVSPTWVHALEIGSEISLHELAVFEKIIHDGKVRLKNILENREDPTTWGGVFRVYV
jgi:hypothetical protein